MAARGNVAKERLIKKFIGASGVRFLGEYDKKYYLTNKNGR